jgi:glucose-6-phosphate isomerase
MALYLDISRMKIKDYSPLKAKLAKLKNKQLPAFDGYKEDIDSLSKALKKYMKYDNVIVIGNGGSNSSFRAFHSALVPLGEDKRMFILTTMEPDLLKQLKDVFPKRNTLVMAISKSGNTIGVIEALFAFKGYRTVVITTPGSGALSAIAGKLGFDIIPHPAIGGRYSGITASAYAPALLFGIDIKGIDDGAKSMYKQCRPSVSIDKNPALQLAASLYLLDQKGYDEIFCPVYSSNLRGFQNFVMQMIHESSGKKGRGQTIFCSEAPDSQHHTNQRFFGGKKNILGLFIEVESQDDMQSKVEVPKELRRVKIRDGKLGDINNVSYEKALQFELKGTYKDAVKKRIPVARLSLDRITPFSVGEMLAFWHYVAVYSSWLRDVDPFDQPQVEASKEISWQLRKGYKQKK